MRRIDLSIRSVGNLLAMFLSRWLSPTEFHGSYAIVRLSGKSGFKRINEHPGYRLGNDLALVFRTIAFKALLVPDVPALRGACPEHGRRVPIVPVALDPNRALPPMRPFHVSRILETSKCGV
jgi:hypothetical protein